MKIKEKLSTLVLVAALTISLSACGTSDNIGNGQAEGQTANSGESQETLIEENNASEETVGGELFSIQTEETYPVGIDEVIDQAADEQSEDARPALSTHIENLDDYDTIFVGYPNWWADMPKPLYTFFDEYDFSRKTIVPFNTHNGSGLSGTVGTIEELEPDATVTEGFTISERNVPDAAPEVAEWLSEIGF